MESRKGDFVETKRCWTLPKSCGSQSSEWEERKKSRAERCRCACHPLQTHTFYIRFHLSLCQRNNYQVRLVHLIVIAVPVPQIQEQIDELTK